MRFTEIRTLTEEQLNELRMSPSSLKAFINSSEADGIRAGFEAELVFSGLGSGGDGDDWEADYDADERAYDIDSIIEFFEYDEWGYGLTPRGARELREQLDERYMEYADEQMYSEFRDEAEEHIRDYIVNNDWDEDEKIKEHIEELGLTIEMEELVMALADMTSQERKTAVEDDDKYKEAYEHYQEAVSSANDELESWVEQSVNDQDGYWDSALDEFRDNWSWPDQRDWLSDAGLRYMSDIRDEFDLDWPYMQGNLSSNEFDADNARQLAKELEKSLGVTTKVSHGYHSAKRDDVTWIFEPDSSLEADEGDMPVEIVSPPMPIKEALTKMREFFKWATQNGAYSNSSTGFHMGVSLPYAGGNVDFVKLALFLGDEHVLSEFGRSGNHFCEAAMKKVRQQISAGRAKVSDAMELMRGNLIELASRSVTKGNFGKYTSINPQNGYIEFRSAGGDDYFDQIDKLENTMMRYAQAMHIASRADLERKEYAKKLYKLIAPKDGDSSLELFAKYTAGTITAEELKKQWAETTLSKDAPDILKKSTWQLFDKTTGKPVKGQQYSGYTYDEAMTKSKAAVSPGSSAEGFRKQYEVVDTTVNTGQWAIVDVQNDDVIGVIAAGTRGEALDQARDQYQNRDYYVRPYVEFDKVRNPLSRRAELAKRIKQGPKGQRRTPHGVPEWELYDVSTNNVINSMVAHNRDDAWQQAEDWLRSIGAEDRSTYKQRFKIRPMMADGEASDNWSQDFERRVQQPADTANYNGRWEIRSPTGGLIRHIEGNYDDAETARRQVMFRYENPADVTATPAPLQQSNEQRHNYEFYSHEDPDTLVDHMTDATADEVRARIAQHERNGMPPGFLRVRQV